MRKSQIKIITEPVVIPIATTHVLTNGLAEVAKWVYEERPECFPFDGPIPDDMTSDELACALFPHNGAGVTDAELLVEFAGRTCYHSYGERAGRKTNAEYIAHTQTGEIPHASIMYHPSFTFFIAGVSRRLSQELMRHNIGAERDWRGNPSQESSRYTEHVGSYVAHPRDIDAAANGRPDPLHTFVMKCQHDYDEYLEYIDAEIRAFGSEPKGMDRKRIFEAAAQRHGWGFSTSFVWTGNAVSLGKLFKEREHEASDLEFRRLATMWRKVAVALAPNLYPQYVITGDPGLDKLIEKARDVEMSPEQKEAQRRSFVYGNASISNPLVTREIVDVAAKTVDADLSASVTAHGG
jgi:thymidylate synthase (FAD)